MIPKERETERNRDREKLVVTQLIIPVLTLTQLGNNDHVFK